MTNTTGTYSFLNPEQKEAIGLLQLGTFLEYFDLMLYVHMGILLNQIFFPKTDPKTASLLLAFAFCSTYIMRPFGALLFGYIGDHIGRKTTVIITMMLMATSCIVMASLPTYAQIGITAAWLVTLCRVIQGISSMGEIIGAEIYLTEITKPPVQYPAVGLIGCASRFGTMTALGVATLVTSYSFNWRYAFWAGAILAIIGSVSRTRLRETPDFVDMKRRVKRALEEAKLTGAPPPPALLKKSKTLAQEKVSWKTSIALFMIYSGPPACLYFSYIYFGGILRDLGFTGEEIIHQNFFVSMAEFFAILLTVFLSYKIHPLKIIKVKTFLFLPFLLAVPFLISYLHTPSFIFLIQITSVCLTLTGVPAVAALVVQFPVFRRFTYISFTYALSRALMSIITSFGLVYLTDYLGYWGLYFIMIPLSLAFLWGILHFQKLDITSSSPFSPKYGKEA